jgi:hypothetical protein
MQKPGKKNKRFLSATNSATDSAVLCAINQVQIIRFQRTVDLCVPAQFRGVRKIRNHSEMGPRFTCMVFLYFQDHLNKRFLRFHIDHYCFLRQLPDALFGRLLCHHFSEFGMRALTIAGSKEGGFNICLFVYKYRDDASCLPFLLCSSQMTFNTAPEKKKKLALKAFGFQR